MADLFDVVALRAISYYMGGGSVKAKVIPATMALVDGATFQMPTYGMATPIAFNKEGGSAKVSLNVSTGVASTPAKLAAGETATITGNLTGADGCVLKFTLNATGAYAVQLSGTSFSTSAAPGTLIGNITGVPPGQTPAFLPNDGRVAIAGDEATGWKLVVGLSASSVGTIAGTISATGATSWSGTLTVTAFSIPSGLVYDACSYYTGPNNTLPSTDGTAVDVWADAVNAIPFSGTGSDRPTFKTGGRGGKSFVRFNNHFLSCVTGLQGALKTAIDSQEYTVLIFADKILPAAGGNGSCIFGRGGGSQLHYVCDGAVVGMINYTGSNPVTCLPWTDTTGFMSFGNSSTKTGTTGNSGWPTASQSRNYHRGQPTSTNNVASWTTSGGTLGIGGRGNFGDLRIKADIYRIMCFNRHLDENEVWAAEMAVCADLGLTHPVFTMGKILMFYGDSRENGEGYNDTNIGNALAYKTAQLLGFPIGAWANFSVSSSTIAQLTANAGRMTHLGNLELPIRMKNEESYNSRSLAGGIGSTPSASQPTNTMARSCHDMVAAIRAALSGCPDLKIMGATPMDVPDSTDATSNCKSSDWGPYMAANSSDLGYDCYIDDRAAMGDNESSANTNFAWPGDPLHPTKPGYTVLANAMATKYTAMGY